MVELPPKRQPIPANKNLVIFAGIARVKNRPVLLGKGGESYFKLFRRQQIIATRNGTSTQSGIDINNHPAVKNIYITIAQKLQNAADNGAVQIAMRLSYYPCGKTKGAGNIIPRLQANQYLLPDFLPSAPRCKTGGRNPKNRPD